MRWPLCTQVRERSDKYKAARGVCMMSRSGIPRKWIICFVVFPQPSSREGAACLPAADGSTAAAVKEASTVAGGLVELSDRRSEISYPILRRTMPVRLNSSKKVFFNYVRGCTCICSSTRPCISRNALLAAVHTYIPKEMA